MAVDESKFSHITVTSEDEEDEVVIHAGAQTPEASQEEAEEVIELNEEPADEEEQEPEQELELEPESEATEISDASEVASEPTPPEDSKDEYHETTLEDIEGSKMPITERIFIILAIVAVIAFVLWYIFVYLGS